MRLRVSGLAAFAMAVVALANAGNGPGMSISSAARQGTRVIPHLFTLPQGILPLHSKQAGRKGNGAREDAIQARARGLEPSSNDLLACADVRGVHFLCFADRRPDGGQCGIDPGTADGRGMQRQSAEVQFLLHRRHQLLGGNVRGRARCQNEQKPQEPAMQFP